MAAIDDLRASVADLQSSEAAESAELGQIADALAAAEAQITQLQGQVSSGAGVSEADLEGLAQSVAAVAQSAQAATAAAQAGAAAPAGGGAPAPDPAGGTAPAPDPTAGGGTAPAERSVYTFSGDPSTVDTSVWPPAGVQTPDGQPLFFFSGDTNPGDQQGNGQDGGAWTVYTGDTQPAAGAGGVDPGTGAPVDTTGGAPAGAPTDPTFGGGTEA